MSELNNIPPNEWTTPLLEAQSKVKKERKCGYCDGPKHNKRTSQLFLNRGTF